jgi:putative salt-induced outer membrane protein YdiY
VKEESAFVSNLVGGFALKVSYAVAYDNLPPPGFVKTDRLLKTALLYSF